ncbi:MAG: hypothetical protein IJO20_00405 [Ruminococcus sp.]|nr:hypothetical protein [Ruminococcus sp.]
MDPNDAVWQQIEFEVLYNGKQEIEDCKKPDSTFAAIIKTKEQYDEIFAVYNDVYDEEFFEDNWLVASVCQVTDERMVAEISELYVSYGDLMIGLDKHIVGGDGIALPTAPPYYSFVAVSKDSVNDVKNIIWI